MNYDNLNSRIDTVVGDDKSHYLHQKDFWGMVKRMFKEYDDLNNPDLPDKYPTKHAIDYVLETYGIQLSIDGDGMLLTQHSVVDEQKFTFGVLKHGGNN